MLPCIKTSIFVNCEDWAAAYLPILLYMDHMGSFFVIPLSARSSTDNNKNGQWRGFAPIPDISLERLADDLEGANKEGFLEFLQRILCWMPEERPTAEELRKKTRFLSRAPAIAHSAGAYGDSTPATPSSLGHL
ncbi:hypothetical protein CIHG_10502 [Coccidioides immitis H538.4]|uniref:Protein kinase domain-containing protein n=1 Tax=Coccidioides immitis H538.4 TaxID=396776 RepID=A0A0J8S773_COCIT|nr:hypothetical protein CIHG_10502 [Coccidioides immitis H538.4]